MNNLYKEISALLMNDVEHARAVNTIAREVLKPLTAYWRQKQHEQGFEKYHNKDPNYIYLPEQEAAWELIDELLVSYFVVGYLDAFNNVSDSHLTEHYNAFVRALKGMEKRITDTLKEVENFKEHDFILS